LEGSVTSQWKYVPYCPTGSCSSLARNVGEPSGFASNKYAMHIIGGGMYVCADLKVTAMVTVLHDRFTKFCCF
jgi:hypothetical protein